MLAELHDPVHEGWWGNYPMPSVVLQFQDRIRERCRVRKLDYEFPEVG